MKPPKPCIQRTPDGRGCPSYAKPGSSYCGEHHRTRSTTGVTSTHRWKKLRARLIEERAWVCGICGEPIATRAEIDLDHFHPLSVETRGEHDPYDESKLQLTHRSCNRRKGAGRKASDPRDLPPWLRARA